MNPFEGRNDLIKQIKQIRLEEKAALFDSIKNDSNWAFKAGREFEIRHQLIKELGYKWHKTAAELARQHVEYENRMTG